MEPLDAAPTAPPPTPLPSDAGSAFPTRWVAGCTALSALWLGHLLQGLGRVSESDEAIVALMAGAIARGEDAPAFFWGQQYMGTVESWLIAPLFALIGMSMPALRLLVASFTVLLVPLAAELAHRAAGPRLARAAALTFACPSLPFALWSCKPRGGFTDVIVVGLGVTWLFLRIAEASTERAQRMRAFAAGAGLGLIGWWNLFGLPFALPGVLVALLDPRTRRRSLWAFGVAGGLLGGSVLLVSNLHNGFATFRHAVQPDLSQLAWRQPSHPVPLLALEHLLTIGLPASLGIGDIRPLPRPYGAVGLALALASLLGLAAALRHLSRETDVRTLIAGLAPAMGAVALAGAFIASRFGFEAEPRYLLGLWLGIAWGWAWLVATLPRRLAPALACTLLGYQLQQVHLSQSPLEHWVMVRGFTPTLSLKPVADALLARGIRAAYADYWTSERLTLDSDGAFTSADPHYPRYPPSLAKVDAAPRPCWISVPWGEAPKRITELQWEEVARFPTDPATGIGEPLIVACAPIRPPPR